MALTEAMRDSGKTLQWDLPGPVVDKHSTGGIGDCVSLLLAPILAEAGVYVPMISGRGLGHTGGTLDKLEAIPGFTVDLVEDEFRRVVADVGCAIVSASANLAPADRRLYAVRDVTGTVESIDLITASILSKKLAAGLEGLALDVKCGSGAFMATEEEARKLAQSLVQTANGAGCRTSALITDMAQPLAPNIGNTVELLSIQEALEGATETRLAQVTIALCGEVLALAGVSESAEAGAALSQTILEDGRAHERFGRMVVAQGGPSDWFKSLDIEPPVMRAVYPPRAGHVAAVDGRGLGMAVVGLGGGRRRETDRIDHRVGLSGFPGIGEAVTPKVELGYVHALTEEDADIAERTVLAAYSISDEPVAEPPLILERVAP